MADPLDEDEAKRCTDLAGEYFRMGNLDRALKFYQLSKHYNTRSSTPLRNSTPSRRATPNGRSPSPAPTWNSPAVESRASHLKERPRNMMDGDSARKELELARMARDRARDEELRHQRALADASLPVGSPAANIQANAYSSPSPRQGRASTPSTAHVHKLIDEIGKKTAQEEADMMEMLTALGEGKYRDKIQREMALKGGARHGSENVPPSRPSPADHLRTGMKLEGARDQVERALRHSPPPTTTTPGGTRYHTPPSVRYNDGHVTSPYLNNHPSLSQERPRAAGRGGRDISPSRYEYDRLYDKVQNARSDAEYQLAMADLAEVQRKTEELRVLQDVETAHQQQEAESMRSMVQAELAASQAAYGMSSLNKKLEDDCRNLTASLIEAKSELSALKALRHSHVETSHVQESELTKYRTQNSMLLEQIQQLEDKVWQERRTYKQLQNEMALVQDRLGRQSNATEEANQNAISYQKERDRMRVSLSAALADRDTAIAQYEDLRAKIPQVVAGLTPDAATQLRKEMSEMKNQRDQYHQQSMLLQQQLEMMREAKDQALRDKERLAQQLSTSASGLQQGMNDSNLARDRLQRQLMEAQTELAQAEERLRGARSDSGDKEALKHQVEDLKKENDDLRRKLDTLKLVADKGENAEEEASKLKRKISQLQGDNDNLTSDLRRARGELDQVELLRKSMLSKNETLEREIRTLREDKENLHNEIRQLKDQLAAERSKPAPQAAPQVQAQRAPVQEAVQMAQQPAPKPVKKGFDVPKNQWIEAIQKGCVLFFYDPKANPSRSHQWVVMSPDGQKIRWGLDTFTTIKCEDIRKVEMGRGSANFQKVTIADTDTLSFSIYTNDGSCYDFATGEENNFSNWVLAMSSITNQGITEDQCGEKIKEQIAEARKRRREKKKAAQG